MYNGGCLTKNEEFQMRNHQNIEDIIKASYFKSSDKNVKNLGGELSYIPRLNTIPIKRSFDGGMSSLKAYQDTSIDEELAKMRQARAKKEIKVSWKINDFELVFRKMKYHL